MSDAATTSVSRTTAPPTGTRTKERFLGVDVARGIALISMLAANVFGASLDDYGRPTIAGMTVIGRSATMFVMVAGISLAFISGGRNPVRGRAYRAAAVSVAVRAALIGGVIGLGLGYFAPEDLDVILPYYGAYFLLAIPMLSLGPRVLAGISAALVVVGPVILLGSFYLDLGSGIEGDPTFGTLVTNPVGLVQDLLVTGLYPAVVYLAYICAGMAIGRLDLSSTKVAARLLVGGLVAAVAAWFASWFLLFRMGGLQPLLALAGPDLDPAIAQNELIWDSDGVASPWWLAVRVHHSSSILDAVHTLGSAIAVLGAVLLVIKLPVAQRLLWPIGVAGAMTLTIYSAHAPFLTSEVLSDYPLVQYLVLVAASIVFAVVWRRLRGQGPLERLVAIPADRARRAVLAPSRRDSEPDTESPSPTNP